MATVEQRTKNVERLKEAHESFNNHDLDAVKRIVAENVTYTDHARGETYRGRDNWFQWLRSWKEAFSDARIEDREYLDAGDAVITRVTGRGTNDGQMGNLPATGKQIETPMCEIVRFNEEGKIISGESFYDQMTILMQLGHMQLPSDGEV